LATRVEAPAIQKREEDDGGGSAYQKLQRVITKNREFVYWHHVPAHFFSLFIEETAGRGVQNGTYSLKRHALGTLSKGTDG
jgi:hypothetical protein